MFVIVIEIVNKMWSLRGVRCMVIIVCFCIRMGQRHDSCFMTRMGLDADDDRMNDQMMIK